jgi:ABC-type multidrug transport system, ATPase and permease components
MKKNFLHFDMIYNKFSNKSMLIIAHRLSTVKNCDRIIVLENCEIREQGTHDELLSLNGQYYRLWEMQQGNFVKAELEEDIGTAEQDGSDDDEVVYT